jgi:transposase
VAYLRRWGESGRFAVEALGCNRWLVNACREEGLDILVADATKLDLRKQGKKTDRRDAREIARRLHLGDLDRFATTYYPTDAEYGRRKLLRVKHGQIQKRTRTVAQIRGLLNAYLLRPPSTQLWRWKSIAWIREQILPTEDLTFSLHLLADDLEQTQRGILALEKRIREEAAKDAEVEVLRKYLPSVGPQTALVLKAELGDATRFKGARAVAAYAGLAPRVMASADKVHHGRMTKCGNEELRWIVSQWAVRMLAFDKTVRAWARPMLRRMHQNKVRMALARRLLVGTWVMLARGELFSLERCLGRAG